MSKSDVIRQWLLKADHDLGSAKLIFLHLPEYYDTIAFHCQQSVEKYLKAYLIYLDIDFKPVHDLRYIINLVLTKDNSFDSLYLRITALNDFAVKIRYPDIVINPTNEELTDIIQLSQTIKELIEKKIF